MLRSPASSRHVVLLALAIAAAVLAPPRAAAQRDAGEDMATLHDRCVAFAHANPKQALERAELWKSEGGGFAADHCIAMALFMLRDYAGAAQRFETLAAAMMGMPAQQRAQSLDQAGQSWLDANDPARAKAAFDAALAFAGDEEDLLIDRSEAYAALKKYWDAIDDLNRALELNPKRADALVYRATAYRYVDALDLALDDLGRALQLAPNAPAALLERGNIRRLKGDDAGAREDWRRVRELAPNTEEDKAAKANLENLATARASAEKPQAKKTP
jgi:tetratricopeptide (TPR) repeat protein